MKCAVISGGTPMKININRNDYYIICADKGYDYAVENNISPDIILGDMDSVSRKDKKAEALIFPAEKDDTDTAIAVNTALNKGYKDIEIFSGIGDRIDHSLGNIQLLKLIKRNGASGVIYSNNCRIRLIENEELVLINDRKYNYFSVLALDNECEVSILGAKYPLSYKIINNFFPLGISNEFLDNNVKIISHNGCILVFEVIE